MKDAAWLLFVNCGEEFQSQILLKVLGELRAIAQANNHKVEARADPAVVVVFAAGLHQIGRSFRQVGIRPPLSAIRLADARRSPGEVIIGPGDDALAGPLAFVQSQVAEAGVFARVGENAAVALVVGADAGLAADLLPFNTLHADGIEQPLLQKRKQIAALRVIEEQDQMGHAGIAVVENGAGVALELRERRIGEVAQSRFKRQLLRDRLGANAGSHVQKIADRDFAFAWIGKRKRFGDPIGIANFGVERELFAAGKRRIAEVGQNQAEGGARVRLAAGVNVEGLGAVAVAIPFGDDVAFANNDQPRRSGRGGVMSPGFFELVPVAAGEL